VPLVSGEILQPTFELTGTIAGELQCCCLLLDFLADQSQAAAQQLGL
jgi:hypothetical protein